MRGSFFSGVAVDDAGRTLYAEVAAAENLAEAPAVGRLTIARCAWELELAVADIEELAVRGRVEE